MKVATNDIDAMKPTIRNFVLWGWAGFLLLGCANLALLAADRGAEWEKVEEALKQDQPKTVIEMLAPLEETALADEAWGEAGKAVALRVMLEGRIEGSLAEAVKRLDAELEKVPVEMRGVLHALSAEWLFSHYRQNRWRYAQRTEAGSEGDDIEAWSLPRILSEIDRRLQDALADGARLQALPVADFEGLLTEAALDDRFRPTLFDFIAHEALAFYSLEETAAARPADSFRVEADSPAFGTPDEFLKWKPDAGEAPTGRAVAVLQRLLEFHRPDEDPAARLHCDLERLRWAGEVAAGEGAEVRHRDTLRRFIEAHGGEVESARARWMLAEILKSDGETLEAHGLAVAGRDAFPDHPYGKLCGDVVAELERRELSLTSESQWSPAGEEILVRHRNLDRVWFRLYSVNFRPGRATLRRDPMLETDYLKDFLKREPLKEWDAPLKNKEDYASESDWVRPPDELPTGYHLVVAAADPEFTELVTATGVHLSKLAMTTRRSPRGGLEGVVVEAVSGAPRAGVEVGLWTEDRNDRMKHVEEKTGDDGFFRFPKADNHCLVVAREGLDRAVVRTWTFSGRPSDAKPFERAVLFTDRAIYRPGQTVHFKGIWCRVDQREGDYDTLGGRSGEVVLRDPNDKEVAKVAFTTNERGSFSGTFVAPEGRALGAYGIRVPQVSVGGGGTSIRIEEYKRPKFFTEIGKTEGVAALGKRVTVAGKAESYTGAPVDGAKVSWRVTRQVRWPSWIRWARWYEPPGSGAEEIAHGETETAADGGFKIPFEAKPDPTVPEDVEPVFEFVVTADVTDGTGETRGASRTVSVAYTTVRATLSCDDWQVAGKPTRVTLGTRTHDGDPRALKGTLKFHRLQEPETCPRPATTGGHHGTRDDAERPSTDPNRWELGPVVEKIEIATDAEKGTAVIERALEAGAYRWVFEAEDANGRMVKAFLGVQVVDSRADDFPTMMPFFTAAPAWTVEPGKDFELLWGSGHDEARACVEWYRDRKLVKREWSAPGRTQQVFRFPVKETDRGGFTVLVHQITRNRAHEMTRQIEVPWSDKELKVRWERIVSKLEPGARQTWTAVIEGGEAAEMVATLYDASLDAFAKHGFGGIAGLFRREQGLGLSSEFSSETRGWSSRFGFPGIDRFVLSDPFRRFELADGFSRWGGGRGFRGGGGAMFFGGRAGPMPMATSSRGMAMDAVVAESSKSGELRSGGAAIVRDSVSAMLNKSGRESGDEAKRDAVAPVQVRTNLQETAFFEPTLTTDADGTVRMTFTMPEALTTWRFLGFAHDSKLRHGLLEGKTVTAKDLMVRPNPPRFLREGDELEFTVKIINQSAEAKSGTARLDLADAATGEDRNAALGLKEVARDFEVPTGKSRTLSWRLKVPDGAGFLRYRATATAGSLTDGEEGWLPVIPRRILVTESMSLPIRGAGTEKFTFDKLTESGGSESLENRFVHLQVVSQPAWYAVMALPYLMEFPHECSEQVFNRYYANALAGHIANADPKIRRIFDLWKTGDTLDSPLLKNQDLKGIMIEETPWLAEAGNESEARRRVGLLFDENHLANELDKALNKLRGMQLDDGLWPWFPGGRGNRYISLYITTGFARLRAIGIDTDITPALKALPSLDAELTRTYERILKDGDPDDPHLTPWVAHHLYTRSFFLKDRMLEARDQAAFDYFVGQAKQYWTKLGSRMSRAHVALALHRLGETEVPELVTRSLKENAVVTEEQGMFWNDAEGEGWWWWQAPIETQAMMIEAFREIDGDERAVDDCQVWLIKQKQVSDWKTTKATADAVYSLLMGGRNLLGSDALLQVSLGGRKIEPEGVEPGTGMYQKRFVGPEVKPSLGKVKLTKTDEGVSWASLHWQYLEDMAKVTAHEGGQLRLEKQLFVKRNTDKGPVLEPVEGALEVGDELVTRLVLRNDRAMEFVHLKDYRGSGTEPVNVLSGYRWQDGFGYYEMTRDTASHFFIDRLPPGTHVFETSVRVQHRGNYQTGIAEIRCMYAPEFAAHSGSLPVRVK
jgi:hypothetical protein